MDANKPLKILIATISYSGLTGVELYIYELGKRLTEMGHEVMVLAPLVGGDVASKTIGFGVKVHSFHDFPRDWAPDVLHVNELLPAAFCLSLWPDTPAVATVHSQFDVEEPFVSDRVDTYICVRPEVRDKIVDCYHIDKKRTKVIYNGIDFGRFRKPAKQSGHKPKINTILFVGTIDRLRKNAITHLIETTAKDGLRLRIVGEKHDIYLDNPPPNVEVMPPRWNVETLFTEDVIQTAGVLLGRSTIEGWAAGIPGWIYDIDLEGNVISRKLFQVPKDISKFDINQVAIGVERLYRRAIRRYTGMPHAATRAQETSTMLSLLVARSTMQGMMTHDLIKNHNQLKSENQELRAELEDLRTRLRRLEKLFPPPGS